MLAVAKMCRQTLQSTIEGTGSVNYNFICIFSRYERTDRQTDKIHRYHVYVGLAQTHPKHSVKQHSRGSRSCKTCIQPFVTWIKILISALIAKFGHTEVLDPLIRLLFELYYCIIQAHLYI